MSVNNKKIINVSFSISKSYTLFALVTLYSILKNNSDNFVRLYICHHNCLDINEINNLITQYKCFTNYRDNFEIILIDITSVASHDVIKTISLWSKDIFSKLFLPQMLPSLDRILHLDVDLIVTGAIEDIYNTNLDDKLFLSDNTGRAFCNNANYKYYNAGFLLMNLNLMRKLDATNKILNYMEKNPTNNILPNFPCHPTTEEQAINACYANENKILALPYGKILTTINYKKGNFDYNINFKRFRAIHYTASKPYYIEKSKIQFNKKAINEYYNHLQPFINKKYKIQFFFLRLYAVFLAPSIHSFYRRAVTFINKKYNKNLPSRTSIIFNKIIKYTQI